MKIQRFSKLDSTNRTAIELGSQGAAHGTFVVADEQTGGRGRLTRQFSSPPGGLYLSAILRPDLPVEKLPLVTLAAGIACAAAVEKETGVQVQLKWPNDLYGNGKKIGGILTEAGPYSQSSHSIPFVVVGIGININTRLEQFPAPIQELATSLYHLTGIDHSIHEMLLVVAKTLLREISVLQSNSADVPARWQGQDLILGKKVSWSDPQGKVIHGVGRGLLPDGRYLLTTSGGDDYPVLAGDIDITHIDGKVIK